MIFYLNKVSFANFGPYLVGVCIYTCRTLGLDLVVRDPEANIIDPDSTGVIELYRRVRLI